MSRSSLGNKAPLSRKCSCDSPMWVRDRVEVNRRTEEIGYILECRSCGANWKTTSPEARVYWKKEMDSVPVVWMGGAYHGDKTVRELFAVLDSNRKDYLIRDVASAKKMLEEANAELSKRMKALEKYEKFMRAEI